MHYASGSRASSSTISPFYLSRYDIRLEYYLEIESRFDLFIRRNKIWKIEIYYVQESKNRVSTRWKPNVGNRSISNIPLRFNYGMINKMIIRIDRFLRTACFVIYSRSVMETRSWAKLAALVLSKNYFHCDADAQMQHRYTEGEREGEKVGHLEWSTRR